jgi:hypothetical protein
LEKSPCTKKCVKIETLSMQLLILDLIAKQRQTSISLY